MAAFEGNSKELINAKRELYHQLLLKRNEDLFGDEVELAYLLSRDSDIQNLLGKKMDNSNQ